MNIFYVSSNPAVCARYLDDGRLVKMVVETAQLLSTALHEWGQSLPSDRMPGPTHRKHPCAIWVRESVENYDWTCQLLESLCIEYRYRYGKGHKYEGLGRTYYMGVERNAVPTYGTGQHTPPPNCTIYKEWQGDITEVYRMYMEYKWENARSRGLHHRFYSARLPPITHSARRSINTHSSREVGDE